MTPTLAKDFTQPHRVGYHRAAREGLAYDDQRRTVAAVQPQVYDEGRADQLAENRELAVEAVAELLGWLVKDAHDLRAVGETLLCFLCETRSSHAPASSARQLAPWLGVSHTTASKRLAKVASEIAAFTGKQREKRTNTLPPGHE